MQTQDILIKPIISEKSLKDASQGKYTFLVNKDSNKTQIKRAIEEVFNVKITSVRTNITKGSTTKNTKVGRKVKIFADKKARVTLIEGQTIAIFDENLGEDGKKAKETKKKAKDAAKVEKKEIKKGESK